MLCKINEILSGEEVQLDETYQVSRPSDLYLF